METRWHLAQNDADWLVQALTCIDGAEAEALAIRGVFHIVLAGGSTPKRLYQALVGQEHDWTRWQVWYGDERCLPADHADRNSAMAASAWLERVGLPRQNIHPIPAELGARTGAEAYGREMEAIGQFDLVLLGLGEDGHTASLFPNHDWGEGRAAPAAMAVFDAPKPPPERVSLSAWRLGAARKVLFLVQGAGKCEAVAAWRQGRRIPATAIQCENGVDVLVDRAAYGDET